MSLLFTIRCWRHGTEVKILAATTESHPVPDRGNGNLIFSIAKCPDCALEDREQGRRQCEASHPNDRHKMGD